jgi:hypothetical protein
VALDFVVPGVRVAVDRCEIDVDGALARLRQVAEMVRAERYEPSPSALCKWCDYRGVCPAFKGEGPDVPGMAVLELQRLRRRRQRDDARIAELEQLVTRFLGEDVHLELPDSTL